MGWIGNWGTGVRGSGEGPERGEGPGGEGGMSDEMMVCVILEMRR